MKQRAIFALALVTMTTSPALGADYWLTCNAFRIHLTNDGRVDSFQIVLNGQYRSVQISTTSLFNVANIQSTWQAVLESLVTQVGSTTTVQYVYQKNAQGQPIKSCTIDIITHTNFLEFKFKSVVGDCGDIRMFGLSRPANLPFNQIKDPQVMQVTSDGLPAETLYCGLVPMNTRTNVGMARDVNQSYEMLLSSSAASLPTPTAYVRDQRFAFYGCSESQIGSRLTEIQNEMSLPAFMTVKARPENNLDYLFLYDLDGVTAQNIIDLCRSTGIYSVLLFYNSWCDATSTIEPFHPWNASTPTHFQTAAVINQLRQAGIRVGLHALIHTLPITGYYYNHKNSNNQYDYRQWLTAPFSATGSTGFCGYTFAGNSFPEQVASDFVARLQSLHADWVYLDGIEEAAIAPDGTVLMSSAFYRYNRIIEAVFANFSSATFQSSNSDFYYDSRSGQTDFWNINWVTGLNVTQTIDSMAMLAPYRRIAQSTPNLGWFECDVHDSTTPTGNRSATCGEWLYAASASLQNNMPLGIESSYPRIMTSPLRDKIITVLRETTRQRRRLGDSNNDGIVRNADRNALLASMNQSAPNSRIDFNLDGYIDQNDLSAFDALYPSLPVWVSLSTFSVGCSGQCCLIGGLCTVLPENECLITGGTYRGDNTTCSTFPCPLGCTKLGDINSDNIVNGLDIAGFVRAKLGATVLGDNFLCANFGTGSIGGDVTAFVSTLLH